MLILASVGLSFPLVLRGTVDLLRGLAPGADIFISNNIALYDILLYLIGDVIPICF
jgi:hypothetical protein